MGPRLFNRRSNPQRTLPTGDKDEQVANADHSLDAALDDLDKAVRRVRTAWHDMRQTDHVAEQFTEGMGRRK